MPIETRGIGFSFNVNTVNTVGTPTISSVFNEFDEFGLLLETPRLIGESSKNYKYRLIDVFAHRANSTYTGLINGITRELGLSLFKPFRIRPATSSGAFIAENPIVVFNGPYVELWRDKQNNILEMEIDRFSQSGPAYTIQELYNYINANSTYFDCDLLDSTVATQRSMTILNQTNEQLVRSESVQLSDRFQLDNPGLDGGAIILNKVFFSDSDTFLSRVSTFNSVVAPGQYYINPYTGDVRSYSISNNSTVRYSYIKYNSFELLASPVIIHSFDSDNFKRKLFEQVLGDDGKYYNGIPTLYGSDLINELLSVYPLYYA